MTPQEENEVLRERVRQLEDALGATGDEAVIIAEKFDLSTTLATLLQMMIKRPIMLREGALLALYGHYTERDMPDQKIIDVFMCKLRKKLAPHGITIETDWGRGYHLSDETKQIITDLLTPKMDAA